MFDTLDETVSALNGMLDVLKGYANPIIEMRINPKLDVFELSPELGKLIHGTP